MWRLRIRRSVGPTQLEGSFCFTPPAQNAQKRPKEAIRARGRAPGRAQNAQKHSEEAIRARGRATGRAQNAQKRSGKAITSAVYRLPRTRETPAPAVARSSYDLQGQAARADGQGSGRGMAPKGRNPARMHQTAPECTQPHPTAPKRTRMHQTAPNRTRPHQNHQNAP